MTLPDAPTQHLQVVPLDDANRAATVDFLRGNDDRPRGRAFERWRYSDGPSMEALIALAGDRCVATMFSMRRRWLTPGGPVEALEPFEWHASEAWRAQAPGFRIVRQRMREPRPMIAVAGTDQAADLLRKLKWAEVTSAYKYALPLSGRWLAMRGRGPVVCAAFDRVGPFVFAPRRVREAGLEVEVAGAYAEEVPALARTQRRFALMREPDPVTWAWLQRAPASVGHYVAFHARRGGRLIGWGTGRVFQNGAVRVGELLEVFCVDAHRDATAGLVREMSAVLAGFGVDALVATTTCPDMTTALRALRFRPDDIRPVLAWWGPGGVPAGPILVDGAIGDHAFYPVPPAAAAAWLEGGAATP